MENSYLTIYEKDCMFAIQLKNNDITVTYIPKHTQTHSNELFMNHLVEALVIRAFLLAPTYFIHGKIQPRWMKLCKLNPKYSNILSIKDSRLFDMELKEYRKNRVLFALEKALPNIDSKLIKFHNVAAFPFRLTEAKIRILTPKKFIVAVGHTLIASSELSMKDALLLTELDG